jgi:hypothetical protein
LTALNGAWQLIFAFGYQFAWGTSFCCRAVSLAYRGIDFAYKPHDPKSGLGTAVKFGWDTAKNSVR